MISVVIPTLNSAATLAPTLGALVRGAVQGVVREVVIADGGSDDATSAIAEETGARFVAAPRGRGTQLAAGAAAATSPWLLFLHGDTMLAPGWEDEADRFMAQADDSRAAAFRFALDDQGPGAAWLEGMVRLRCILFKLPYGDQGLLISRTLYDALGGYRPLPLMEDVDLVRRIGPGRLTLLHAKAVTSADRYRKGGYLLRPLRNLGFLALYFLRVPPERLARWYGYR